MTVIQTATALRQGDAIGADIMRIHELLAECGHKPYIAVCECDPELSARFGTISVSAAERIAESDPESTLVIQHKASGDELTGFFLRLRCKRLLIYHNITPASYFLPYDLLMTWNLWRGRRQLKRLAGSGAWAWGDSAYNCRELADMGFDTARVRVMPCLEYFDKAGAEGSESTEPSGMNGRSAHESRVGGAKSSSSSVVDGTHGDASQESPVSAGAKILFVGRIAPNKKQEDVIKAFCCYKTYVDKDATLTLIGSPDSCRQYYAKLLGFVAELGLGGVRFAGHVSAEELAASYRTADLFLCMSEHEGFCVPLVEAMRADLPIIAYDAAAVGETLGEGGVLIRKKNWPEICGEMERVLRDGEYRARIILKQRGELRRFDGGTAEERFRELLREVTGREGEA